MPEPIRAPGAVFLSYASQDAEAAKRICDALRSAGVEVWFDAEGGLEHGDEWDQKIRRQIKECVLFIAVISANTQAREEGYFRIEWELAAQRAMGIASGVAFILPIVIDDTREPAALVPDRFRAVQWTRLPGGTVSPDVQARFLKLWSHRTGVLRASEATAMAAPVGAPLDGARSEADPGRRQATPLRKPTPAQDAIGRPGVKAYALLAACVAVTVALAGWWLMRDGARPSAPVATNAKPAAVVVDFPRDPELKRAVKLIYSLNAIEPDFALAEDIVKPVLASRPNDPEVVTVAAMVAQEYLTRGFDTSDARRATVQKLAERAVQLAPDNPDALAALGRYLAYMRTQLPRAEELIRRAIELRPDESRYYRNLLEVLVRTQSGPEVEALITQMVARFPMDALVRYDLARSYKDRNDVAAMEKALDETVALGPVAFAFVWKSWIMLGAHGDVAGMKAALDRVPDRQRTNTRVVNALSTYGIVSGDTKAAIKLVDDLPETWLSDFSFNGPKALLFGDLLTAAGRKDPARLQYEAAYAEIQREKVRNPTDLRLRTAEMWTLLGLGRREEAHALLPLALEDVQRPYRATLNNSWWSGPIRASLLLGEREQALTLIKEAAEPQSRLLLRNYFTVDPRMAPFRDDPEIKALLAEPVDQMKEDSGQKAAPPQVDQKSVAVLAFANLSDDKNNEYFSDGISEELLNVLAKVPGLKVTARTSSFHFKGKDTPIPEIAQQLGVAYVVEGSVRKAGDKVRITAQLIKAADGFHVWSDTFTRELKDIFAVQDEIAGLIAQNLRAKMAVGRERSTVAPEAYALVLQARHAAAGQTIGGRREAVKLYREALALAPGDADAWAELAYAYQYLARFGGLDTGEGMREARLAARQALELDPEQPLALAAFGWVQRTDDHDWRGAVQSFRHALAAAPENVNVMSDAAICFLNVGHNDEAVTLATRATERDPLNPQAFWTLGIVRAFTGDLSLAEAPYRRAIELAPTADEYHSHLARVLTLLNRLDEARALALAEPSERYRLVSQAGIYFRSGDAPAGKRALDDLAAKYGDEMAGYIAAIWAQAGNRDEAFKWLERAYGRRDSAVAWSKTSKFLDNLTADPRWPVFLRKLGLADDQLK